MDDSVLDTSGKGTAATGLIASGIALLCCASVAPVVAVLTAIGAGFLLTDAVLIPILAVALGVTLWGLRSGYRRHARPAPVVLALLGSVIAVGGLFVWVPLAFGGFAMVVAGSVWNLVALRACSAAC